MSFLAAGAAGASSSILLYPLEVVRSRMTVSPSRYPSPFAALRQIRQQEGPAALYRGLPASVASIIPEAAITYGEDLSTPAPSLLASTSRSFLHWGHQ